MQTGLDPSSHEKPGLVAAPPPPEYSPRESTEKPVTKHVSPDDSECVDPSTLYLLATTLAHIDPVHSHFLLDRAARIGHVPSLLRIATQSQDAGDPEAAAHWFAAAASRGCPFAAWQAGLHCIATGQRQRGYIYVDEAALRGDPELRFTIGCAFLTGDKVDKNVHMARQYLEMAAKGSRHLEAKYALACVLNGLGDVTGAERWIKEAAELGHPQAAQHVEHLRRQRHFSFSRMDSVSSKFSLFSFLKK
ncbi:hypothetical protein BC830DRAFT_1148886 [Chytriomyces sp. MP71]|nr:hypothetical protein BC830DRAFT_1148886 [Chytriomyces sp. MP71]